MPPAVQERLIYNWDFGDGEVLDGSKQAQVSHTYQEAGDYPVTVTIQLPGKQAGQAPLEIQFEALAMVEPTDIGLKEGSGLEDVEVAVGEEASFSIEVDLPETVKDRLTYAWDFGDGTIELGSHQATHSYQQAGDYTAKVIVALPSDEPGQKPLRREFEATVVVEPTEISFLTQPINQETSLGKEVTLSAQVDRSNLPSQARLSYEWDFGDKTMESGQTLIEVAHVYPLPGHYTVIVTATLVLGSGKPPIKASAQATVLVIEDIKANITFAAADPSVSSIMQGLLANFSASADSLSESLTYEWDFGDGSKVEGGQNLTDVTHVYEESGNYRLILTVTNEFGNSVQVRR